MSPSEFSWLPVLAGALLGLGLVGLRAPRRRWLGLLSLVAGLALALLAPVLRPSGPTPRPRTLRVLSVLDLPSTNALLEAFESETGIHCEVDPFTGGARQSAELLIEERLQPDLYLGGTAEMHDLLADAGLTVSVPLPADPGRVRDYDDPAARYTPFYLGYLALVHRPLPEFRQTPPEWNTLADPRWRGRVSLPSPASTSGGLVFLATQLLRQPGIDRGWTYLDLLADSEVRWEPRSEDVITEIAEGGADLGVAWAHDVWRRRETDRIPVELRIPARTGYEIGAVSVLRWAKDREAAEQLVRFLTGARAARLHVRHGLRVPLRTDVAPPAYVVDDDPLAGGRLVFYDRRRVLAERENWIRAWEARTAGR